MGEKDAPMPNRRQVLTMLATGGAGFLALGGYAFGIEPLLRLNVTRYDLPLARWPTAAGPLRIALVADLHAVDPWMLPDRVADIVSTTNALAPDLTLLLGDYVGTMRLARRVLRPEEWAEPLADLRAPLGVHAILGNHDWWWEGGPAPVRAALEKVGIGVLVNDATRIATAWGGFWLTGTDSIVAERTASGFIDRSDLKGTLAKVTDGAPVIHMAHEPDLFTEIPDRVALTVSGHTHGGQVRLPFLGPLVVPSAYGDRYAYGHVVEAGKNLVVSGGLGCSGLPVRFLMPPEIVLVTVKPAA